MKLTDEIHQQGFNCAETIIKAYNAEHGTDIPVQIGSGLGGGVYSGTLCGAVNAAAIVLGWEYGRSSSDKPNEARKLTSSLVKAVREKYGTELCAELKKNRVSCEDIINFAYETLNKTIEENKK
ncbi:MAG: C-GCAxxG-C-C family (seleno)protein [Candidatus Sumerlaeales bacterium]|nr:C-GCAxxG-C-C family (seleno)protein [Candidatus Sumerlaeales bacterium]